MSDITKNHPFERLKQRAKAAEDRIAQQQSTDSDPNAGSSKTAPKTSTTIAPLRPTKRGTLITHQILNALEERLEQGVQLGLFNTLPMKAGDEFPTLLTRLPIFMPSDRRKQRDYLDDDLGLVFDTPFGKGRRLGPPLTVRDEDVLLALLKLRSKRLYGSCDKLPIPIAAKYAKYSTQRQVKPDEVEVHTVICTMSQVIEELGLSQGGKNYQMVVAAIKRLGATTLEIVVKKHDRYFGDMELGTPIKLLDVEWISFKDYGMIEVQFTPIIVAWLEQEYTYISWSIRKQLKGEQAKAIHRFLSSQNRSYENEIVKIAASVGIRESKHKLKTIFDRTCQQLVELGWLEHYTISGTGRSKPHVLHVTRKSKTA